jgi:hypothetical protein
LDLATTHRLVAIYLLAVFLKKRIASNDRNSTKAFHIAGKKTKKKKKNPNTAPVLLVVG